MCAARSKKEQHRGEEKEFWRDSQCVLPIKKKWKKQVDKKNSHRVSNLSVFLKALSRIFRCRRDLYAPT